MRRDEGSGWAGVDTFAVGEEAPRNATGALKITDDGCNAEVWKFAGCTLDTTAVACLLVIVRYEVGALANTITICLDTYAVEHVQPLSTGRTVV